MIKGLHHNAYRCRDSEETRGFYEDFLGLRLVSAFEINEGRALHTFFEMDDGSCLAFFEVPGAPFEFKRQDTLDLHIALGVEPDVFDSMLQKGRAEGIEVRGPVDHGFVRSIYFRDPNGYVIEFTASTGTHGEIMDPAISKPHAALAHWQDGERALIEPSDVKMRAHDCSSWPGLARPSTRHRHSACRFPWMPGTSPNEFEQDDQELRCTIGFR